MSNLKEAIKKYDTGYYECPHGCDAVYHTYSFTHREFECKDCRNVFLVPSDINLNKPQQFKRAKREGSPEPKRKSNIGA